MNKIENNEVDLYRTLLTLWKARKLLSVIIIFSLLLGTGLVYMKTPIYNSYIEVDTKKNPIIFNSKDALLEFERSFYSKKVFDDWKKESNSSINFKDFSREVLVNRFVASRTSQGMAMFILRKNSAVIRVTSSELSISSQFYDYAKHVNGLLNPNLLLEANRKLSLMEKRYKGRTTDSKVIIERLSSLDRYISRLSDGFKILEIRPPTVPVQTNLKTYRTIGISVLIGFIIGIFFVLIKQAYKVRKSA